MATIAAALIPAPDMRFLRVRWLAITTANAVGAAVEMASHADRSVQVVGNFGTGGEITIDGSNDGGTTYAVLTDPQGNALVFTSARLEAITELVGKIRPQVSAGSGAVNLDIYVSFGSHRK